MREAMFLLILLAMVGQSADGLANPVPDQAGTPIYNVQGSGSTSPMLGQVVTISAIVTGDFQDHDADMSNNLGGFYVQQELPDSDGASSEGIFVFDGRRSLTDVYVGDRVDVEGTVHEYFGETQLSATSVTVIGTGLVQATDVNLPAAGLSTNSEGEYIADLERYEGMLVRFPQTLTVVGLRSLEEFGVVDLAHLVVPVNRRNANSSDVLEFANSRDDIAARRIILDDGLRAIYPFVIRHLRAGTGADYSIRVGDSITGASGNLRYSRGSGGSGIEGWRVVPADNPEFHATNLSEQERTALRRQAPARTVSTNASSTSRTVSTNASSTSRSGSTGADRIIFKGIQGAMVGAILGLIGGLFYFIRKVIKKARKPAIKKMKEFTSKSSAVLHNVARSEEEKLLKIDDDFFSAASSEISNNDQVEGLWLKSLILADGNEEKRKATYIRLRAKQLSDIAKES